MTPHDLTLVPTARPSWTTGLATPFGTALDPSVEELSWLAWELQSADPEQVNDSVHRYLTGGFAQLVETAWNPGRAVVLTEIEAIPSPRGVRLVARLLLGCGGPTGTSLAEVEGLRSVVERVIDRPGGPYTVASVDPRAALLRGVEEWAELHTALIRQRTVTIDGIDGIDGVGGVEVVSRFNLTLGPWTAIAERLADFAASGRPVRVRATVLATALDPFDRLEFRQRLAAASALAKKADADAETVFNAERAKATLLDHQARLTSPVLIGEIAVMSPAPLPDSFLRSVAAAITSEVDVARQEGRAIVAGQHLIVGGYAVDRDPKGLTSAQQAGLPLRGGLEPRTIRDLITLGESPLGWPIPIGRRLLGIAESPTELRVPAGLRVDPDAPATTDVLGTTAAGLPVGLSHERRLRHLIVTGNWGAGKSTVASHLIRADLEAKRPFLLVDPHGPLAEHVRDWAKHLRVDALALDVDDPHSGVFAPFDQLRTDGSNLDEVERQIARWLDAVAASLPNPEFASVRWFAMAQSWALVQAAHGASFDEAMVWLNDGDLLLDQLDHPLVSRLARSTLLTVVGPAASREAADMRGWVSSKFHALVSGPVRRILAAPGEAPTIGDSVRVRRPIICNLGGLSTSEAFLVGHLVVDAGVAAVLARPTGERTLFGCYVDEAHRFPTPALQRGLAEGRKYGLSLLLIAQAYGQWDPQLADLAMSAGTQILFRPTPDTANRAEAYLGLNRSALNGLKDLQAVLSVQGIDPVTIDIAPYATVPGSEPEAATGDEDRQGGHPSDPSDGPSDVPANRINRNVAKNPVGLVDLTRH